jgi:hypothetical protein
MIVRAIYDEDESVEFHDEGGMLAFGPLEDSARRLAEGEDLEAEFVARLAGT